PVCHESRQLLRPAMTATPNNEAVGAEALARRFHETYERLAPSFGYETRAETREFDPTSANGRLMIAACETLAAPPPADAEKPACHRWLRNGEPSQSGGVQAGARGVVDGYDPNELLRAAMSL